MTFVTCEYNGVFGGDLRLERMETKYFHVVSNYKHHTCRLKGAHILLILLRNNAVKKVFLATFLLGLSK